MVYDVDLQDQGDLSMNVENSYVTYFICFRYGDVGAKHQISMQRTLVTVLRNELNRVEYVLLKAIVLCNRGNL